MISFKQYLTESSQSGNYVCTHTDAPNVPDSLLPKSGTVVPAGKHHLTLVYSEFSDVDQRLVNNLLQMLPDSLELIVTGSEVFDSKDDEGNTTDKGTLVLKIKNSFIDQLHESLVSLGMQHSYPEYAQHVTVAYKVDREECYEKSNQINAYLMSLPVPIVLNTNGYESKAIDRNWADSLKKD